MSECLHKGAFNQKLSTWTEICHFLNPPPPCVDTERVQKQTFFDPLPSHLVHVVIECSLTLSQLDAHQITTGNPGFSDLPSALNHLMNSSQVNFLRVENSHETKLKLKTEVAKSFTFIHSYSFNSSISSMDFLCMYLT